MNPQMLSSGAETQYADLDGRRLAYRMFGSGQPLILCLRFRGVMDSWDPAFLDALARRFRVVVFDYTGLGLSTGNATYDRSSLASDAKELADYLDFDKVVIGGWSLGGVTAQVFATHYPEKTSHIVLIGTVPPGQPAKRGEPVFMQTAMKTANSLQDEYVLFFEPESDRSRASADRSHQRIAGRVADRSPLVPEDVFLRLLSEAKDRTTIFPDPDGAYATFLASGRHPTLVVSGDHDIACPVENWFALWRSRKSLHLLTIPQSGHAPHHQEPEFVAAAIASFAEIAPEA